MCDNDQPNNMPEKAHFIKQKITTTKNHTCINTTWNASAKINGKFCGP